MKHWLLVREELDQELPAEGTDLELQAEGIVRVPLVEGTGQVEEGRAMGLELVVGTVDLEDQTVRALEHRERGWVQPSWVLLQYDQCSDQERHGFVLELLLYYPEIITNISVVNYVKFDWFYCVIL